MKVMIGAVALNTKVLTEVYLDTLGSALDYCQDLYSDTNDEIEVEIVVVDNGSTDGVMSLKDKYPWVKWIRNETNLGVAPAWNQIIKQGYDNNANPLFDYYLICNNDVYWSKKSIANYIECLKTDVKKEFGWISFFFNDYKEPDKTGVTETVDLENIYWSMRPHADQINSPAQMLSLIERSYGPFGGIEKFADNLTAKYGVKLVEMHPKASMFGLSKECIQKIGLFEEWMCPVGIHEDSDYWERLNRYGTFKVGAAYGSYVHHFSMMTRTKSQFENNKSSWAETREVNFKTKWLLPSKQMDLVSKKFGMKLEIGPGANPILDSGWYHLDVDKNAKHVEFLHNTYNRLPFDDNTIEEIFTSNHLEHIEWRKIISVLRDWHRVMKPYAKIHIRVPNFAYLAQRYLEKSWQINLIDETIGEELQSLSAQHAIFGGEYPGEPHLHKAALDFENLSEAMIRVGFRELKDVSLANSWELRIEAYK